MREELDRVKENSKQEIKDSIENSKVQFEAKFEQSLKVSQLEHECETASVKARVETYKQEVANLNTTLSRMADELRSQKELTLVLVNQRLHPSN